MNSTINIISALTIILVGAAFYQLNKHVEMKDSIQKKVNIWDTYVTKKDGSMMHFDIVAPVDVKDTDTIYRYGKAYLKTKGQEGQALSSKQCRLCHIETLRPEWEIEIDSNGYFIIEMEGCG